MALKLKEISLTFACGFHPAGCVDSVAEEAVARHLGADDAGDNWAHVDTAANLQPPFRPVRHCEHRRPRQQVERHRRNLGHVLPVR